MDQICPKRVFRVKNEKIEQHHWILHIRISLATKFYLKLIILTFWTKFAQKGHFQSKTKWGNVTNELGIRISLGIKFQHKLVILTFRIKFAQKGYFRSKTEKVNTAIDFCIFELFELVSSFTLNWQFWLYGPNFPKNWISSQHQKKCTAPLTFAYST